MTKIYLIVLFLLCTTSPLRAQTSSITNVSPEISCLGAIGTIQVTLTDNFQSDNKFSVQLRKNSNSPVLAEIPAILAGRKLEVIYRDSSLTTYPDLQLRVVATSPKTESSWVPFQLHSKGVIVLGVAETDTINADDDWGIKFTGISSTRVSVTLNDSSKFNFGPVSGREFVYYDKIKTDKTKPFFIAHAENTCGIMRIDGEIKAVVNPTSLRIINVSPIASCEGSEIQVGFSTFGTPLNSQSQFWLRLSEIADPVTNTIDIPAMLKDGKLTARLPESLNVVERKDFNIKIVVVNPSIVSSYSDFKLTVYPKPDVQFYTQSTTVPIGQKTTIGVNFTGFPPYSVEFENGENITSQSNGRTEIIVRPDKSTSYKIESFSTGCGQVSVNAETMVVNVEKGIYLEQDKYQILCVGALSQIPIKTSLDLSASTKFTVHAFLTSSKEYSFPAKLTGNFLEFVINPLPAGTPQDFTYEFIKYFYVTADNPAATSNVSNMLIVRAKPTISLDAGSILNYNNPGYVQLNYSIGGGSPYIIEYQDGITTEDIYSTWRPEYYITKNTDFTVKSITNSCAKSEVSIVTKLTVNTANAPIGIHLNPLLKPVCANDSVEIELVTTGIFNDGNVFNIQGYGDCCAFQTLMTVPTGGKYKIKIPKILQGFDYNSFRIASTNPVLFSNSFQVAVQNTPGNFSITPQASADEPAEYLKDELIYISLKAETGSLTSFVYSDGKSDKTAYATNNGFYETISPPIGITTAYTIKSATNQCGTVPVNEETYIRRVPYQIAIPDIDYSQNLSCTGNPLVVPFAILKGQQSATATFSLELTKAGINDYRTLVKDEKTHQFQTMLPTDLDLGNYLFRIVSSEGAVSKPKKIRIGSTPTAKIETDRPQPVLLQPGESLNLSLSFTGSTPRTVVYENDSKQTSSADNDTRKVTGGFGQQFSIKTVYNSCGYGTPSGSVTVKVKPVLSSSSDSYYVCEGGSFNIKYRLEGDADLVNDYIRFELVDVTTKAVTALDSVRNTSGNLTLKLPSPLTGNVYQIRSILKSANLVSVLNVSVTTKANVFLSGSTVINYGESALLMIRSSKNVNEVINYKLSNGFSGTFYGNSSAESFIRVSPFQTTTYTLSSVSNSCGEGRSAGSAVVEVNPASDRTVTTTKWSLTNNAGLCTGDTILVNYTKKGIFSPGNVMTVQISDTTGQNFRSITTIGNISPLKAVIPEDLFSGKYYRIRVVASDAQTGSGAYEYFLVSSQKAKARFASETVYYDGISLPKIVVLLEGVGPWRYDFGTDLNFDTRISYNSVDSINLQQVSPIQYYKLFRVYNQCGLGTIENPGIVRVEIITGDPNPVIPKIIVAPNPTQDFILIKSKNAVRRNLLLYDLNGTILQNKFIHDKEENLDIRNLATGMYLLQIEEKGRKSVYKIVKY